MTKEEIFYEVAIQMYVANNMRNPDIKKSYNLFLALSNAKYFADKCEELVNDDLTIKQFNPNEA